MNKRSEDESPQPTRFEIPDFSDLYRRSDELAARARVVDEQLAEITSRLREVIGMGDEHLNDRRPSWRSADADQT